jgi:hypothetical protein
MNYQHIYETLMQKGISRVCPIGYYEKHHIVPKCMGGADAAINIVKLTAREHFIAHILLAKIYGGKHWHAVVRMAKQTQQLHSRAYAIARIRHAKVASITMSGRKMHSQEFKDKLSTLFKGVPLKLETRKKMSVALRGRSVWNTGLKLADSHKSKIGESLKNKPWAPQRRFQQVRRVTLKNWDIHA